MATSKAEREQMVRDFFRGSDLMETFSAEHQEGRYPWASIIDHAGRLVVSDSDRSVFYAVRGTDAGFDVLKFEDALALADPEIEPQPDVMSRSDGMLLAEGLADPDAAFRALCADAELDLPVEPTP